jgi:hypothetical protein
MRRPLRVGANIAAISFVVWFCLGGLLFALDHIDSREIGYIWPLIWLFIFIPLAFGISYGLSYLRPKKVDKSN